MMEKEEMLAVVKLQCSRSIERRCAAYPVEMVDIVITNRLYQNQQPFIYRGTLVNLDMIGWIRSYQAFTVV
jgi:hypothetical protein